MTDKNLPSIEYLHKRLRYEPETGKLFWRDCEDMPNNWRAKMAGREAFSATNSHGYRCGAIDDRLTKAHRVIWALYHNEWPKNHIDHINGVKSDNRIFNLRDATSKQNNMNAAMRSNNTSGVTGVCWNKKRGKWQAEIKVDGRKKHLGLFDSIESASSVRADASRQYGFTDRHGK